MIETHPKQLEAFKLAEREIGLEEIVGPAHEGKIVGFFADVGHEWVKDDETAWCAAFAGAMLERAGLKSTRALNAQSYLKWEGAEEIELEDAQPGDIVIFKRGRKAWQGHVGFYVSHGASSINTLGGNQSNAVNIKPYKHTGGVLLGIRRMPAPPMPKPKSLLSVLIQLIRGLFGK